MKETKLKNIETHLRSGKDLTHMECWQKFKSYRLAAVVHTLRGRGMNIHAEMETSPKTGARYARYKILQNSG
jgi:hypothetical protein